MNHISNAAMAAQVESTEKSVMSNAQVINKEELIEKLKEDYKKLSSMTIYTDDSTEENLICLSGARYRGEKNAATMAQVRYLQGLKNVSFQSTSNLLKANKWFISAAINIAKENEDFNFNVSL